MIIWAATHIICGVRVALLSVNAPLALDIHEGALRPAAAAGFILLVTVNNLLLGERDELASLLEVLALKRSNLKKMAM